MAVYRQVHVSFWQDPFIVELTPEEKYFYLYLMTNSKTKQCGVYEISKRVMELETGYNRETVDKLLKRFIEYGKAQYNEITKEIFLINWLRYNLISSPKVIKCIQKELKEVKCIDFVNETYRIYTVLNKIDTISIPYTNGIIPDSEIKDTVCIPWGEERELITNNNKENKEGEKEQVQSVVTLETNQIKDSPSGYRMKLSKALITIEQFTSMSRIPNFRDQIERIT